MAEIDDLLDYAHQKNYAQADRVFNDLISNKMSGALDFMYMSLSTIAT